MTCFVIGDLIFELATVLLRLLHARFGEPAFVRLRRYLLTKLIALLRDRRDLFLEFVH